MKFDVQAVESIISSSPRKNGCFNLFFKLNDKIGIKLSNNIEQRDSLYETQSKASQYGLGPEVYGKIDNIQYEGKTYWGYFTEVVWVFENVMKTPYSIKDFLKTTFEKEIDDLVEDLYKFCRFSFEDYHWGNIGVKNGRFVCIDFDSDDYASFNGYNDTY